MKKHLYLLISVLAAVFLSMSVVAATSVPEPVINATESVVRVLAEYSDGYATGSGFVIKSDKKETLIVTNYHVVEGKPYSISVWISEDETVSATILAHTKQKDMCILELSYPVSLQALNLVKDGAQQGDAVYAVGFPGAADYLSDKAAHASTEATVTDGIVSAVREATVSNSGTPTKILQINAAINSGNSGGPLFNANGDVVGINTLGINDSQGIFGAIDVSELKIFMTDHSISFAESSSGFSWKTIIIATIVLIFVVVILMVSKKAKIVKIHRKKQTNSIPLYEYMAEHPNGVGINNAVAMLLHIAIQLRDLHNNGNAHLELSPNSVFVDESGAHLNSPTLVESNRYTSGYAAPEIYRGAPAGNRSDIYSFCALLSYVAIGKQPTNSLSRTSTEFEPDENMQFDPQFVEIINEGTSLEATERPASMQDIILKLSGYNTHPFVNNEHITDHTPSPKIKPQNSKRITKSVVIIALLCLVVGLFGTYLGCYLAARTDAKEEDFSSAGKLLFIPAITKIHDPNLVAYAEAGQLMDNREYAKAADAFSGLDNYNNAKELANEANYRLALQYADMNKFSESIAVLKSLSNYRDAKEKINEVQYRWAWALIDEGEYIDAYEKLDGLGKYSDAEETLAALTEVVFAEGQLLYADGSYDEAEKLFKYIAPYSDSNKYLTLIKSRDSAGWDDPDEMVSDLIDIFYFEDATEMLMAHDMYACRFLLGTWYTNGGGYYLKMETSSDDDYEYWCSYNLPWWECTSFEIDDGTYYITTPSGELKKMYEFTLLAPDCIEVYCYKNGSTYTLYR